MNHDDPSLLETVTRAISGASTETLIKITQLLDRLPDRALANQLTGMLDPQIAALRKARGLSELRLLFLPLDPVIVATGLWKPEDCMIPRAAIRPIGSWILAGLSGMQEISARLATASANDRDEIEQIGLLLWSQAAQRLAAEPSAAEMEAMSDASGVEVPFLEKLMAGIAAVMTQIRIFRALALDYGWGGNDQTRSTLQQMLTAVAQLHPRVWSIVVALLIACSRDLETVLRSIRHVAGALPNAQLLLTAVDHVCEQTIERIEVRAREALAETGKEPQAQLGRRKHFWLSSHDVTITNVLAQGLGRSTQWGRRIAQLQSEMGDACLAQFQFQMSEELLAEWPKLDWPDDVIDDFERGIWTLQAFASTAAQFGNAEAYCTMLHRIADRYLNDAQIGLSFGERIRIVGLLLDTQEASTLLPPIETSVF